MPEAVDAVCGLLVEQPEGCVCWINMPTFKSNSLLIRAIAALAALVKLPSRVTTFVEMALDGSRNGTEHVLPLRQYEGSAFSLSRLEQWRELAALRPAGGSRCRLAASASLRAPACMPRTHASARAKARFVTKVKGPETFALSRRA